MKIIRYIYCLSLVILLTGFAACNTPDEDKEEDIKDKIEQDEDDPILKLVKANVSASVYYSDYSWNITINSDLERALPGENIIYGTECGYNSYYYYRHFKFNSIYENSNGKGRMTVLLPVFIDAVYANEALYWSSYMELKAKKERGERLDSDELDLYNSIIQDMNKAESKAKSTYCGRLYAQIDNSRYYFYTFGKTPSSTSSGGNSGSNNNGSGGGGSSSSYEKPEIGLVDYTCNTTSITLKYRIYNQDKANVTSAKGYYGKSSASTSTSATVSGSMITMNVKGLSKGTTYYFKCTATGSAGSTTSDTVKLMTLY